MSINRAASFFNEKDNLNLVIDGSTKGIVIESIEGIYSFAGEVLTSPYSQTDGDRYKNSRMQKRNIVIRGTIFEDFWANRQLMYRVFRIGTAGRFGYIEEGKSNRYADYYVEAVSVDQNPYRGRYQISLICPDPYFYDANSQAIELASWFPDFTFEHNFLQAGEEIGHKETSMIDEIVNLNGVDGIGVKIILTASGDVVNPYVYLNETGEQIKIGTSNRPYTITSDKKVEIETETGKKNISEIINGIKTRINEYLDPESAFFQLGVGKNTIGYNAESGATNLNVRIEYRMRYLGV